MSANSAQPHRPTLTHKERTMRRTLGAVVSALGVTIVFASVAIGQAEPTKVKRIPVSVVLTSDFPYSGDVVILRRPEAVPSDLIVMRTETATPEAFSEAVRNLIDIRRVSGDSPQANALLRTHSSDSKARRKPLPWSQRVLGDLRAKPIETFNEFTNAQVIEIWLPPTKKNK